jgi:hypothetical protein
MLRYWTEMLDAGIPMPAASASMPMPSNGKYRTIEPSEAKTTWRVLEG